MQFIRTPNRGAPMNTESWGTSGTYLNGGGFVRQSFGGHMNYVFEWPDSSSRQTAQLMRSYRRGTYGRGLIYFIDPLIYDLNILPARWADPSIACDNEGASMVYGLDPEAVATSGWETHTLPIKSAYYNLASTTEGYRDEADTLFVPIPTGYTLYLGAIHTTTGNGVIEAYPVDSNGNLGAASVLTKVAVDATNIVPDTFSGGRGVRIQLGKSASGAGTVTVAAMTGRLYRTGGSPPAAFTTGPWVGGAGHSGCRFDGEPTYVANTGLNGGTIGFAASFKEVGSWV
jgi:hypothetical protein